MSIHPSLKGADAMKRHRSVLTRLERIQRLHERGALDLEKSSFLGLPKVRHLRIRIKKEKAAATPVEGAAGATATTAAAPASRQAQKAPAQKTSAAAPKAPEGKKAPQAQKAAQSPKKE